MPHMPREIWLRSMPDGMPTADNFALRAVTLPSLDEGQVEVRNLWMSVDPYMRAMMSDRKTAHHPYKIGDTLDGRAIGQVAASRDPNFAPGDMVLSMLGWREAFVAPGTSLTMLPHDANLPPAAFIGVAGMVGLTGYLGIDMAADLRPGDVVFVSGAAGAVGHVACQVAKIRGHVVIGSAGSPEKLAFLKSIGVDHAIDYRAEPDLPAALRRVAPGGIDVFLDTVGGRHIEAALEVANPFARFVLCGSISQFNGPDPQGVRALNTAIVKSIRMEGFVVNHHADRLDRYIAELSGWVRDGRFVLKETVAHGLEQAPRAFINLFAGGNVGKAIVKLG